MRTASAVFLFAGVLGLAGCAADPQGEGPNPDDGDPIQGAACQPAPGYDEDVSGCGFAADAYQPRSGADAWPACISDDDGYHMIGASVSSIARVQAYEAIADLLWRDDPQPTIQDFIDARVLLEQEQGLGSRLARRYDTHYPAPAAGGCEDASVPEQYPDYCVGPATLQPLLNEAFASAAGGQERIVNAARIHAALQWFLYVSAVKEATTCTVSPGDCDSSWAYYSGGQQRAEPLGLGAEIRALAPETDDRVFDGILAVRCWRNLDHEAGEAQDLALRDRAIGQLDRALLRGMAVLIRQRFAALGCASGDYLAAEAEALRILVPLFDRATRERDPDAADFLLAEIDRAPAAIDAAGAMARLDAVYDCFD